MIAGKAWRVFAVEDDDGACVLKMDAQEVQTLFTQLGTTYSALEGAIDSTFNLVRTVKAASALVNFLSSAASFITSKDDFIGTALEDGVVTTYFPGSNWIIRGPGNATKGHMKLEMKP